MERQGFHFSKTFGFITCGRIANGALVPRPKRWMEAWSSTCSHQVPMWQFQTLQNQVQEQCLLLTNKEKVDAFKQDKISITWFIQHLRIIFHIIHLHVTESTVLVTVPVIIGAVIWKKKELPSRKDARKYQRRS